MSAKEVEALAKKLHRIAVKAVRKSEGFSDGKVSDYKNISERTRIAMRAIAKHVLRMRANA